MKKQGRMGKAGGIDTRKDILLLLLWSPGEQDLINETISGRTRLVKSLFLFKQEVLREFRRGTELSEESFYTFFPWKFGPFSGEVYDDVTFFVLRGFIEVKTSDEEALVESREEWSRYTSDTEQSELEKADLEEYQEEAYCLTEVGLRFVGDNLVPKLTRPQRELLRMFKRRIKAPLRSILRYTYEKYPSYTEKSEIKRRVLTEEED